MDASKEEIITEGYLQKQSKYLGIFRKRWMVLTDDNYLYSYKQKQIYKTPTEKIDLCKFKDVIVGKDPFSKTRDGSFQLVSSSSASKKSRWFLTGSINDMMKWVQHIKCSIKGSNSNDKQHKNSNDTSSRKTSDTSAISGCTIKYILDNVSFTSNNTYNNTDINYNISDDDDDDLDCISMYDIYDGVLEIQNDTFTEYDNCDYDNYEEEEKMVMKRDSEEKMFMKRDSISVGLSYPQQSLSNNIEEFDDSEIFYDKYDVGVKVNDGTFGSVFKIMNDDLKCVKMIELLINSDWTDENEAANEIELRRDAAIKEYHLTQIAFSDEIIGVELFIDDIYNIYNNEKIESPKAYLIMPYFNGKDLYAFIDDNYEREISMNVYLHIFYKIMETLYELHYIWNIIHGDLKLENIMILNYENGYNNIEVKIIDYGIAKPIEFLSDTAAETGYFEAKACFGTKGYIAPEIMLHCKYNRKIDVFSCGVILYHIITGCFLFPKGNTYYNYVSSYYYKYLKRKFKQIKKKKMFIRKLLYSCLAFDPDQRLDVKQLLQKYFDVKNHA